jgi:hypothetical protein
MRRVWIRKISNTKSLNRRAYIILGMLFLNFCVIIYVVLGTTQLHNYTTTRKHTYVLLHMPVAYFHTLPSTVHNHLQYIPIYSTLPSTVHCYLQHTTIYSTMPSTVHCHLQYTAICSTLPSTVHCHLQYTTIYSTLPSTVHYNLQYTAIYSTLPSTVRLPGSPSVRKQKLLYVFPVLEYFLVGCWNYIPQR